MTITLEVREKDMGILDIFRSRNSTDAWQPDPRLGLTFDLDKYTLGSVALGEPVDRLCGLGPAEDKRDAKSGIYRYYSRGLSITTEHDCIHVFRLVWHDPDRPEYQPYVGICTLHTAPVPLNGDMSAASFVQLLGEPNDQTDDSLIYHKGESILDAQFSENDRLSYLIVGLKSGCKYI